MKKAVLLLLTVVIILILTGCMYPESERIKNSGPIDIHIDSVEVALERFYKENGVYPIKNSNVNTPIYEKYIIDMNRLYPKYLGYLPPNAFENGGPHLYVIVNIETDPKVRVIDLKISSQVENIQRAVNQFHYKKGTYPFGNAITSTIYEIDYKKLGVSAPEVISPFSDKALPLMITEKGEVLVDYMLDIGIFINEGYAVEGDDARHVLVDHSYFVPVKSTIYRYHNGKVVLGE